jgi:hypothetical protein
VGLIGYVDELTRFWVSGWLADASDPQRVLRAVVAVNGEEQTRVEAAGHRAGLERTFPGATGRYAFQFYFDPPLSPFVPWRVVVTAEESGEVLANGEQVIAPIGRDAPPAAQGPRQPILVSTTGRSGSTLLMGVLAAHPGIVVADRRPFEIEMLCYYGFALRTLVAPGDHLRSLRPDMITARENRFGIGFNPYTYPLYREAFAQPSLFDRFCNEQLPSRLQPALRDIITDYYAAVAEDQGKRDATRFAEKCLPEPEARQGARYLFGAVKEIVLLRDLRDVLCSFVSSSNPDLNTTIDALAGSARRFLQIREEADQSVLFLRYEDLVRSPAATLERLFSFLELPPVTDLEATGVGTLFAGHATSRTAADSIGRWRRDLTEAVLAKCEVFDSFLGAFGYEATRPVIAAAPVEAEAAHELAMRFESLGENCEFGLFQRRLGAEPLGLLRFASAPLPVLLRALRKRLSGLGRPEFVQVALSATGEEYMVRDTRFGFEYHAWVEVGAMSPEAIHAREAKCLPLLARKLVEDLTEGRKLFVYHALEPVQESHAAELAEVIRTYGPGTLLWVECAGAAHRPGRIVRIGPGLLKGYIDRFAPGENAHDFSFEGWLAVCRSALAAMTEDARP